MAELHRAELRPGKLELLAPWMGSQRWYAAKGSAPQLTALAAWRLGDPAGEVGVETHLVMDTGGPEPLTYQVPVTYRAAAEPALAHALIGTIDHGTLGTRWVYDGVHDPVYAGELFRLIRGEVEAESSSQSDTRDSRFHGEPAGSWTVALTVRGARVISGEQSNTSIILDTVDGAGAECPVIVKVFRILGAGDNPDVVLQSALREAGCDRVPRVVGALRGTWPTSHTPSGGGVEGAPGRTTDPLPSAPYSSSTDAEVTGHLAFAQEFIPNTEDAWRVALRAATAGHDFTTAARDLGVATATVHTALAQSLGSRTAGTEDIARLTAVMRRRLHTAAALVPAIAERAGEIEAIFAAAEAGPWPPLQRIHGDYHLGQVLHSPDRGWLLLDFEGEPLRPLAERVLPDSTFRDMAGMLRSLDYAGGSAEHDDPSRSARAWVDDGVAAFLEGYSRSADDPRHHATLLTAFLLDKALYEVVYEARNRPTWLALPAAAISRLLGDAGRSESAQTPERGWSS